jgi:hypothetical protein
MAAHGPTLKFINEDNLSGRMVEITRSDGSTLAIGKYKKIQFQKADGTLVKGSVIAFAPDGKKIVYSTGPDTFGSLNSGDPDLNRVELVSNVSSQAGGARRIKTRSRKTMRRRRHSRRK